jgi:nitrogen fixation NifU-like protein
MHSAHDTTPYLDVLLELYRNPLHKHTLPGANAVATEHNPLCGDEITLMAVLQDNIVKEAAFLGDGCVISQASASLLTDHVIGKTISEAQALTLENLLELLTLKNLNPTRQRCANIALAALHKALP